MDDARAALLEVAPQAGRVGAVDVRAVRAAVGDADRRPAGEAGAVVGVEIGIDLAVALERPVRVLQRKVLVVVVAGGAAAGDDLVLVQGRPRPRAGARAVVAAGRGVADGALVDEPPPRVARRRRLGRPQHVLAHAAARDAGGVAGVDQLAPFHGRLGHPRAAAGRRVGVAVLADRTGAVGTISAVAGRADGKLLGLEQEQRRLVRGQRAFRGGISEPRPFFRGVTRRPAAYAYKQENGAVHIGEFL
mmetsp:Transcript_1225/g.3691  ORF Transcript_1225/g.3691 Transcript_1225/m.3691 type:complete len:247 (-) Transcript_1225:228-968(-)